MARAAERRIIQTTLFKSFVDAVEYGLDLGGPDPQGFSDCLRPNALPESQLDDPSFKPGKPANRLPNDGVVVLAKTRNRWGRRPLNDAETGIAPFNSLKLLGCHPVGPFCSSAHQAFPFFT